MALGKKNCLGDPGRGHRRAVSAPWPDQLEQGGQAQGATIILRPTSPSVRPGSSKNVFSFTPAEEGTTSPAPLQTIPAVILGPQGTISGFIQMPVTASPGRRIVQSRVHALTGEPSKPAIAPPELHSRALPPVPTSDVEQHGTPPTRGKVGARGEWLYGGDQQHTKVHGMEATCPAMVKVDSKEGALECPLPLQESIQPTLPSKGGKSESRTLKRWQSAFGSYAPKHSAPEKKEVDTPPPLLPIVPPPAEDLCMESVPHRKTSRIGLIKEYMRPAMRRHRSESHGIGSTKENTEHVVPPKPWIEVSSPTYMPLPDRRHACSRPHFVPYDRGAPLDVPQDIDLFEEVATPNVPHTLHKRLASPLALSSQGIEAGGGPRCFTDPQHSLISSAHAYWPPASYSPTAQRAAHGPPEFS